MGDPMLLRDLIVNNFSDKDSLLLHIHNSKNETYNVSVNDEPTVIANTIDTVRVDQKAK